MKLTYSSGYAQLKEMSLSAIGSKHVSAGAVIKLDQNGNELEKALSFYDEKDRLSERIVWTKGKLTEIFKPKVDMDFQLSAVKESAHIWGGGDSTDPKLKAIYRDFDANGNARYVEYYDPEAKGNVLVAYEYRTYDANGLVTRKVYQDLDVSDGKRGNSGDLIFEKRRLPQGDFESFQYHYEYGNYVGKDRTAGPISFEILHESSLNMIPDNIACLVTGDETKDSLGRIIKTTYKNSKGSIVAYANWIYDNTSSLDMTRKFYKDVDGNGSMEYVGSQRLTTGLGGGKVGTVVELHLVFAPNSDQVVGAEVWRYTGNTVFQGKGMTLTGIYDIYNTGQYNYFARYDASYDVEHSEPEGLSLTYRLLNDDRSVNIKDETGRGWMIDSLGQKVYWHEQEGGNCARFSVFNALMSVKMTEMSDSRMLRDFPEDRFVLEQSDWTKWLHNTDVGEKFVEPVGDFIYQAYKTTKGIDNDSKDGATWIQQADFLKSYGFSPKHEAFDCSSDEMWNRLAGYLKSGEMVFCDLHANSIWSKVEPENVFRCLFDKEYDGFVDTNDGNRQFSDSRHNVWVRGVEIVDGVKWVIFSDTAPGTGMEARVPWSRFEYAMHNMNVSTAFKDGKAYDLIHAVPPSGYTWKNIVNV